jgi:hypothetical protein
MLIGAAVLGYIVHCVMPERHHPEIAGVLAALAAIAGLPAAGIEPAAIILIILEQIPPDMDHTR